MEEESAMSYFAEEVGMCIQRTKSNGILLKRDIAFTIDLVLAIVSVSRAPYRISSPQLRELQLKLE